MKRPKILFDSIEYIDSNETDVSFGKGYRSICVVINDKYYDVCFYEPVRVMQTFDYQSYFAEPNSIIIPNLTLATIKKVVTELSEGNFFEFLKDTSHVEFINYKEATF